MPPLGNGYFFFSAVTTMKERSALLLKAETTLLAFPAKQGDVFGDTKVIESEAPGRQEAALYILPFLDAAYGTPERL